jgi:hypothetical protein
VSARKARPVIGSKTRHPFVSRPDGGFDTMGTTRRAAQGLFKTRLLIPIVDGLVFSRERRELLRAAGRRQPGQRVDTPP